MSTYWAFNGGVRASDADRERAVASLKRHYAAGRLKTGEFERRVARAYRAEWRSELRSLLRDLPVTFDRGRVAGRIDRMQQAVYRAHFACFATINTAAVSIWAWSGGHDFWPAWTLIPGGALLAWHRKGSRQLHRRLESRPRRALTH
jgi:hypothetical protein